MKERDVREALERTEGGEVTRAWSRPEGEGKAAETPTAPAGSDRPTGQSRDDRARQSIDKNHARLVEGGMSSEAAHRRMAQVARETDAKQRR